MEKQMCYGLKFKDQDFVSYKVVDESKKGYIFVYTHSKNGKARKKKVDLCGYIRKHDISKKYAFFPNKDWCFSANSMLIIGSFIFRLERNTILFDIETGELKAKWVAK